jgi:hypothetical protein
LQALWEDSISSLSTIIWKYQILVLYL